MIYIFLGKKKKKQFLLATSLILLLTVSILTGLGYDTNYAHALLVDFFNSPNLVLSQEKKEKIKNIYSEKEKVVYLTFDDGPTIYRKSTEKVLDILKKQEVKATFFVVGSNVEKYPELVKREYEEGHYIANHTYSHKDNLLYKNKNSFLLEVLKTDKVIRKRHWDRKL